MLVAGGHASIQTKFDFQVSYSVGYFKGVKLNNYNIAEEKATCVIRTTLHVNFSCVLVYTICRSARAYV